MASVLMVAAEAFELRYIPRRNGWVLLANGPGPVLAGEAVANAVSRARFDAVISVGLCGALDPQLRVGDVVAATAVNGIPLDAEPAPGARLYGPIASVNRVIGTVEGKHELFRTGAVAVEMEAAGVLRRARALRMPCLCVKAVSDTAEESFHLDFNQARDDAGRFVRGRIVAQALRRPLKGLPELWKLRQRSEQAARALGEFFEHCSI